MFALIHAHGGGIPPAKKTLTKTLFSTVPPNQPRFLSCVFGQFSAKGGQILPAVHTVLKLCGPRDFTYI